MARAGPTKLPIHFPSSLEDGITIARDLGLFDARASETAIRKQMAELEALAAA